MDLVCGGELRRKAKQKQEVRVPKVAVSRGEGVVDEDLRR